MTRLTGSKATSVIALRLCLSISNPLLLYHLLLVYPRDLLPDQPSSQDTHSPSDIVQAHGMSLHLYADDTQLYISCGISEAVSTKEQQEQCVSALRDWMSANLLKLNDDKTEFMVIGTRHTLQHGPNELTSIKLKVLM